MLTRPNIVSVALNAEHAGAISKGIEYLQRAKNSQLLKSKNKSKYIVEAIISSAENAVEVAKALVVLESRSIAISGEILDALLAAKEGIPSFVTRLIAITEMNPITAEETIASLRQLEESGKINNRREMQEKITASLFKLDESGQLIGNSMAAVILAGSKSKPAKSGLSMFSGSEKTASNDPQIKVDPSHTHNPGK